MWALFNRGELWSIDYKVLGAQPPDFRGHQKSSCQRTNLPDKSLFRPVANPQPELVKNLGHKTTKCVRTRSTPCYNYEALQLCVPYAICTKADTSLKLTSCNLFQKNRDTNFNNHPPPPQKKSKTRSRTPSYVQPTTLGRYDNPGVLYPTWFSFTFN
jgi:hypothetical protein